MIITIDGPAGTGKTTIARRLADRLGFVYVDTGAMYRALTYGVLSHHIDLENSQQLATFLNDYPITIQSLQGQKHYFLATEDVTDKIRGSYVTRAVSKVSSYALVRQKLVQTQQRLAIGLDTVFEGRDLGTVVFPQAELKIFLTADPHVRATRRYQELLVTDPSVHFETILEEINKRDTQDASRALSPMKPAADAIILDTSTLSIDEVLEKIIQIKQQAGYKQP